MLWALALFLLLRVAVADEGVTGSMKEYSLPYPPSGRNECKDPQREYYHRKVKMCCSKCPPGSYQARECSKKADSVCTPCGPNAFTEVWNGLKQCHHCEAPCREESGLIEAQACNASQNRICGCPPSKYCAYESGPSCQVCAPLTPCPQGFGVSVAGSRNSNTECTPCPRGTFSDVDSYDAPCIPHRNCSVVSVPGGSTHDAICADSDLGMGPGHTLDSGGDRNPDSTGPVVDPSDAPTLAGEDAASPAAVAAKNNFLPLGVVAGVVLFAAVGLAGLALLMTSAKKRYCSPRPRTHTAQLHTVSAKQYDKKPADPLALGFNNNEPEQAYLLMSLESINCSLDVPPGPADIGKSTQEKGERPATVGRNGTAAIHHDAPALSAICSAEPLCSGHAHVNLTCIVNVCKPDHVTCLASSVEEGGGTPNGLNDHLPLSMEEGNVQAEPEGRRLFEVGGTSLYTKGEGFPLSVQNTEMKTSEFSSRLKMR